MFKKSIILFLFTIVCISCTKETKFVSLNPANYSHLINQEFSGDLAFETTSFVEKYWRVVGNTGFNKSVYNCNKFVRGAGCRNRNGGNGVATCPTGSCFN